MSSSALVLPVATSTSSCRKPLVAATLSGVSPSLSSAYTAPQTSTSLAQCSYPIMANPDNLARLSPCAAVACKMLCMRHCCLWKGQRSRQCQQGKRAHLYISSLAEEIQADLLLVCASCQVQWGCPLPVPCLQGRPSCLDKSLHRCESARAACPAGHHARFGGLHRGKHYETLKISTSCGQPALLAIGDVLQDLLYCIMYPSEPHEARVS